MKPRRPHTSSLILPRGWSRLPVSGTDEELRAAVAAAIPAGVPRDDAARARAHVEGRLRKALQGAQDADALDFFLPLGGMGGFAVPASFLTMEAGTDEGPQGVGAALSELSEGRGAAEVVVDFEPALRTDVVAAEVDAATEVQVTARQVDYLVPIPGSGRVMIVAFAVVVGDQPSAPYVDAAVQLFDAVMTTFRWRYPDA